jgi:O-antigen/teichoic acid export membrane protein
LSRALHEHSNARQPGLEGGPHSVTRNTVFALLAQFGGAAFTAVLTLYLVRVLGPREFGVFSLALSIGLLVMGLADFGVSPSAERFIAQRPRDRTHVVGVLSDATRLKLVLAPIVSATLILLAGPIANAFGSADLLWPLRAVAVAGLFQSIMQLYTRACVALGRTSVGFRVTIAESATELAASVALVAAGGGASGAALGRAIGYFTGTVIAVVLIVRLIGRRTSARSERPSHLRALATYAGVMFAVDLGVTGLFELDSVIVGALLTTTQVGLYKAPMRFVVFLTYPGLAVTSGIAPRMGVPSSDRGEQLARGIRILLVTQAAAIAPMIVCAEAIVELTLGPEYEGSVAVVRALAPYVLLLGVGPLVTVSVNYMGEARRRIRIVVVTLLLNIGLSASLLRTFGVTAAAISIDVAFGYFVLAHIRICHRLIGLPLRALVVTSVRALVAAGVMAATLVVVGPEPDDLVGLVAVLFAGLVAYAAALVVSREVRWRHMKTVIRVLRPRR